jgi:hypothetical protein
MDFKQRRDSALRERGLVPPASPTSPRRSGLSHDKQIPAPAPVPDARTAARQAALRERGLLPAALDQRDLSAQEAERDRRMAVLAAPPTPRESAGPSAAQRLMDEWRAKNGDGAQVCVVCVLRGGGCATRG